jgi:hypothetical protein
VKGKRVLLGGLLGLLGLLVVGAGFAQADFAPRGFRG